MKPDYRYSSVAISRGGATYEIIGVWDYKAIAFDTGAVLSIKKNGGEVLQELDAKEKASILAVASKEYQSRQWGGGERTLIFHNPMDRPLAPERHFAP